MRHTHATLVLVHGINPKVVSERLGHASVAFTLDTYSHVVPGLQEMAAQRIETIIGEEALAELGATGGEKSAGTEPVVSQPQHVGKMLANVGKNVGKKGTNETEPPESRTRNLLIKRDKPSMLPNAGKENVVSGSKKSSIGYYLTYYLVPHGIIKFVGKNVGKNTPIH